MSKQVITRVMVIQEVDGITKVFVAGGENVKEYANTLDSMTRKVQPNNYFHFKEVTSLLEGLAAFAYQDKDRYRRRTIYRLLKMNRDGSRLQVLLNGQESPITNSPEVRSEC